MSIPWGNHYPYMFSPFALISRCLDKLQREDGQAVLIAPIWPNQVSYLQLLHSLMNYPIALPALEDTLTNPAGHIHPLILEKSLPLAAWPLYQVCAPDGLSDKVINIINRSWRGFTEAAYTSAWKQ